MYSFTYKYSRNGIKFSSRGNLFCMIECDRLRFNSYSVVFWILIVTLIAVSTYSLYLRSHVPDSSYSFFEIKTYVAGDRGNGEFSFVTECKDSKIQSIYYIDEGKLYFQKYLIKNLTSGEEHSWVGGVNCDFPDWMLEANDAG